MSLRKDPPATPPSQPAPPDPDIQAASKLPEVTHPVVISFALVKKGGNWAAVALKSQGRTIVDELVLELDDTKNVSMDKAEVSALALWRNNRDPFKKYTDEEE